MRSVPALVCCVFTCSYFCNEWSCFEWANIHTLNPCHPVKQSLHCVWIEKVLSFTIFLWYLDKIYFLCTCTQKIASSPLKWENYPWFAILIRVLPIRPPNLWRNIKRLELKFESRGILYDLRLSVEKSKLFFCFCAATLICRATQCTKTHYFFISVMCNVWWYFEVMFPSHNRNYS